MELDYGNLELFHSGVPGMKWHKHIFGKWQKQATYAEGMSDPNAKDRKHRPIAKKSSKSKGEPEKKMTKEEIRKKCMEADDPKFILENKHLLTTNELNEISRRMQVTQQLKSMSSNSKNDTSKVKKAVATGVAVAGAVGTTAATLKKLGIIDIQDVASKKVKDVAQDMIKGKKLGSTSAARKRDAAYKKQAMKTWDINELDKLRAFLTDDEYAKRLKTILLRNKTMSSLNPNG